MGTESDDDDLALLRKHFPGRVVAAERLADDGEAPLDGTEAPVDDDHG